MISTVEIWTGCSDRADWTLNPQRSVVYSKGPKHVFANRTRPVMLDRTLPASGHTVTSYCADRQHDRTQPFSVRSPSDLASDCLTDASVFAATPDQTRRSNQGQRPVTSSDLRLFCLGRRWSFLPLLPNFTTLDQMCQPPSVSPCAHVLAYFHEHFQGC